MIKSMTGFGSADFICGATKGTIEMKSVNHRYLDIAYFLPPGFVSLEDKIRQKLQKNIRRGRVTVFIKIVQKVASSITFNKNVINTYLKNERVIKKEYQLSGDLSLTELIRLPGVVDVQQSALKLNVLWPSIEKGLKKAITSLSAMRKREGASIIKDARDQISRMSIEIKKIQSRERKILAAKKKKLSTEEFQTFQKGIDVNEELSRLLHHTAEYKRLLSSQIAVGKKLDFIGQEMQREANTIGSKLQDKVVSTAVVVLKSKIEKLREQAQNVE